MPPVDAPDDPMAADATRPSAPMARRHPLAHVISPASWGRRRASVADLIAGGLLAVLLTWSAWSMHLAALEVAAGRVTYSAITGYRPTDLTTLAAHGVSWYWLLCPAGVAFVVWMLLRGWNIVISTVGLVAASVTSVGVGLFASVGVITRLDYAFAFAVASALGATCAILTVDAFACRVRLARDAAASAIPASSVIPASSADRVATAGLGIVGVDAVAVPSRRPSAAGSSLRTAIGAIGTIVLVVVLIDRLIAWNFSGDLLAPPLLLPIPLVDH